MWSKGWVNGVYLLLRLSCMLSSVLMSLGESSVMSKPPWLCLTWHMDTFVLQPELRFPLHSLLTEDLICSGSFQWHLQKRKCFTLVDWSLMGKATLPKTDQRNIKWVCFSVYTTESAYLKQEIYHSLHLPISIKYTKMFPWQLYSVNILVYSLFFYIYILE